MLASDGTRGLVAVTVSVLGYAGRLELWHVLAASLIFGLVDAFFQPAYAVLLPQIVPAEDLPSANSLTSLSLNLGRVASIDALGSFGLLPIGLALAGWATERVGPPTVFVASGLFTALVMVAALAHPAIRGMD
jgi:MFS family permease